MCAGVGNTQAAKSGLTFWFSNPESSLPVARVPDVLSKAPSLGRLWDTGYPSKSAWPPPFGAAHGGSGSLASGSCTTLAHALRPHLPPWHGPSFWDPAPPPPEAAEEAQALDRTPLGAGPNPTTRVPQKPCFMGENQAQATCPRPQQGGTCSTGPRLCLQSCPSIPLVLVGSTQRFLRTSHKGGLGAEHASEHHGSGRAPLLSLCSLYLGMSLWLSPAPRPGLVGISQPWTSELCPGSQRPNLPPSCVSNHVAVVGRWPQEREFHLPEPVGGSLFSKKGLADVTQDLEV